MGEPQYGSLVWATRAALRLAADKVLFAAERKKLFLQTLVLLITGNAAKHTDPAILMAILNIVRTWLLTPAVAAPAQPGRPAEAVSLTEKARRCNPARNLGLSKPCNPKSCKPYGKPCLGLYERCGCLSYAVNCVML